MSVAHLCHDVFSARVEVVIRDLEHKRTLFQEIAKTSQKPTERRDAAVRASAYEDALDSFTGVGKR